MTSSHSKPEVRPEDLFAGHVTAHQVCSAFPAYPILVYVLVLWFQFSVGGKSKDATLHLSEPLIWPPLELAPAPVKVPSSSIETATGRPQNRDKAHTGPRTCTSAHLRENWKRKQALWKCDAWRAPAPGQKCCDQVPAPLRGQTRAVPLWAGFQLPRLYLSWFLCSVCELHNYVHQRGNCTHAHSQ